MVNASRIIQSGWTKVQWKKLENRRKAIRGFGVFCMLGLSYVMPEWFNSDEPEKC